ncbi:Prokaryotic metallothionein [Streptomyces sp. WAC 05977]|nr:Prokaryotic metallothionein [Streptomyces sp. WAC 05977]
MAACEVCGNDYEKTFEIHTVDGGAHTFDSFECAIHQLAPICDHCGCRVVGHGVQVEDRFFCCAHCARESAVDGGEKARDAVATS